MSVDVDRLVGRMLATKYRVIRVIGSGGMGIVFEALHVDLGRRVALKILAQTNPKALARFGQEALATAKLDSPHIVSVTDFRAHPGEHPFIVMELLEGHTLNKEILKVGALPIQTACAVATELLSALATAHAAGIVHRDVKPANVFLVLSPNGERHVKLVDFGIAKLAAEAGGIKTTAGTVLGTPAYVAPEQIFGDSAVDARSDVHAVGVVLYEMLVGRRPWAGRRGPELGIAILREPPPPIARGDLPPGLAEVIARALAKDPAHRFLDATEMLARLRAVLGSQPGRDIQIPRALREAPANAVAHEFEAPDTVRDPTEEQTLPIGMVCSPEVSRPTGPPVNPQLVNAQPKKKEQQSHARLLRLSGALAVVLFVATSAVFYDAVESVRSVSTPTIVSRSTRTPPASPSTTVESPNEGTGAPTAAVESAAPAMTGAGSFAEPSAPTDAAAAMAAAMASARPPPARSGGSRRNKSVEQSSAPSSSADTLAACPAHHVRSQLTGECQPEEF